MAEQVTAVTEEPTGKSLEQEAREMGIDVDGVPEGNGDDQSRPEWLPDKFQSPEDLAKAYSELERRQSQPRENRETGAEEAKEAVESAGVDFQALSDEWAETGELSPQSYEALEKAGIPNDVVNSYIEAQTARMEVAQSKVYESVGGQEAYQNMISWASNSLSEAEIDAYNTAVNSNNMAQIELAVNGLKSRYSLSEGQEPSTSISGNVSAPGGAYRSLGELMEDMQSPKYRDDSAFRADVEAKLARSNILESRNA
tara:strand:+ start:12880 stop:13647 length:768 start_codon:yes stop_codon:yes gene_type:complete